MSSKSFGWRDSGRLADALQAIAIAGGLIFSPAVFAADEHASHEAGQTSPAWAEKLKGQTVVEDAMEGRADRAVKVDLQHQRLMRQMESQAQAQGTSGGYNTMSSMHQYAGQEGASFLLASQTGSEPVKMDGGRCPASAPVKAYDVSMIAIEIT
ncbi:MAG: hypothetical protein HY284_04890, partial [Nitrospirae bacterium]|nr:hypothetical protein [Nitrospirota bacterium]